jgi:hypothetical protein
LGRSAAFAFRMKKVSGAAAAAVLRTRRRLTPLAGEEDVLRISKLYRGIHSVSTALQLAG